jgi:hypothetical protein
MRIQNNMTPATTQHYSSTSYHQQIQLSITTHVTPPSRKQLSPIYNFNSLLQKKVKFSAGSTSPPALQLNVTNISLIVLHLFAVIPVHKESSHSTFKT